MLRSLFPKAHPKFLSMPVLGPVVDGFDDWLTTNGYTRSSRKYSIRILQRVDADLRLHQVGEVANLTHSVLHDYWKILIKTCPNGAGTVRALERYLLSKGLIVDGRQGTATLSASISEEYANHLREVRGFAASTISHHWYTAERFLQHLEEEGTTLRCIQPINIESYIVKTGKRLSRASLQHDIGGLRGFLRFLATKGKVPAGLDRQIDTPRLYRLEQLPRALPWETVRALLRSIDTASAMGL